MRKADNLPPSCAVVTKSGKLKFLEPSGPVQACNGIALPFYKTRICALSWLIAKITLNGVMCLSVVTTFRQIGR